MTDLGETLERLLRIPVWEWPDDSPESILAGMHSDEADQRRTALDLAAEIIDDEVAAIVLRMVTGDIDEEIAARAAIVLGPALEATSIEGFDYDEDPPPLSERMFSRVLKTLEKVYRDAVSPKLVRRRALEAAVRAPASWQIDAARAAWQSDDEDWRITAVFCMGYLEGFEQTIVEALKDASEDIRYQAVIAAGTASVDSAGELVKAIVANTDQPHDMRIAAIDTLGQLRAEGVTPLLQDISATSDPQLAVAAREALAMQRLLEDLPDDI